MRKILKILFLFLGSLLALAVLIVSVAWFKPSWIITPSRVEKFSGIKTNLNIEKPSLWERKFNLALVPGCHSLPDQIYPDAVFCLDRGELSFTIRLHRKTILQLSALNFLDFRFTSITLPSAKEELPPEAVATSIGPPPWMKYLAEQFAWGPLNVNIPQLKIGGRDLVLQGHFSTKGLPHTPTHTLNSPPIDFQARAKASTFNVSANGQIEHRDLIIYLDKVAATYTGFGKISFDLSGSYDLSKATSAADFRASWKNPMPQFLAFTAEKGHFQHDSSGWKASSQLKLIVRGRTPLGKPPTIPLTLSAEMKAPSKDQHSAIDVRLDLPPYHFSGIHAVSDLWIRIIPLKDRADLELKRGELRIQVPSFLRTAKMLEKTSWAVPAPFAVLDGTLTLKTAGLKVEKTHIPLVFELATDLRSPEQTIQLTSVSTLALSPRTLAPKYLKANVRIKNVTLRIPDYDPIASVPPLTHDSRIVREEENEEPTPDATAPGLPIEITVDGDPGSLTLLNRYFKPALTAKPSLRIDTESGLVMGEILVSKPFGIKYLNREIRVESLRTGFDPRINFSALISLERAGYHITAKIEEGRGKTQISLGSTPPLSDDEIVSLILYGMPKTSISSEQTKSVGSAQTAINSDALGIFSFWAFASTPIESVVYDPTTQTYSAVVRLPGGVIASIGSNWEKDRQVSLSRSLGKNWAVSTELIKDPGGVDRGGTLLRWRKSY